MYTKNKTYDIRYCIPNEVVRAECPAVVYVKEYECILVIGGFHLKKSMKDYSRYDIENNSWMQMP